jgi:hypothetical protein
MIYVYYNYISITPIGQIRAAPGGIAARTSLPSSGPGGLIRPER